MRVLVVDRDGRILIPAEEIEKLGLRPGDELLLDVRGDAIVLRPLPKPVKVRANREWGKEAFLKAGEATFGD